MYAVDFVEFPSSSASASVRFFGEAFGWAATPYGPDYVDVRSAGITLGFQADANEQPHTPLVAIRTDDLEQARRAIEDAGGVFTVEPFDFPGGRRFHFREPGGCELAVWCSTERTSASADAGRPYHSADRSSRARLCRWLVG